MSGITDHLFDTAVLAAAIGAATAGFGIIFGFLGNYFVTRINLKKEISLKMAEYRINWINNLRNEFAEFLALSLQFTHEAAMSEKEKQREYYVRQLISRAKLEMLMNKYNNNTKDLNNSIAKIVVLTNPHDENGINEAKIEEIKKSARDYLTSANKMLHQEWQRTKNHLRSDTVNIAALRSKNKRGYIDRLAFPE